MRIIRRMWLVLLPGVLVSAPVVAEAPPKLLLPMMFTDHMVLQRDLPVPVWGVADPAAEVSVTWQLPDAQPITRKAVADAKGRWMLLLPDLSTGGPGELVFTVNGRAVVTLKNVLVGEVWLCSGQSNMKFRLGGVRNAEKELATTDRPMLRLLHVWPQTRLKPLEILVRQPPDRPQTTQPAGAWKHNAWSVCTPESAKLFSAVGYLFGRELQEELDVPVGLIQATWGGTPAEAWTPMSAMQADDFYKPLLTAWKSHIKRYNHQEAMKRHQEQLAQWQKNCDAARKAGRKPPRRPRFVDLHKSPHRPAVLYNGMIAPLVPYAVRGVIWYQGEANAKRAWQYARLFPDMIRAWREQWNAAVPAEARPVELPFFWVSLANFRKPRDYQPNSTWAELREAQSGARKLPRTGQALAIDVGEAGDIHPKDKQTVAARLARCALADVYGKDVACRGPSFADMEINGPTVTFRFENTAGGLVVRGKTLRGFALAGEDRSFHPAEAKLLDGRVVLSCPQVSAPIAVRYNWADNPPGNLYNAAGLPAEPFRSDDWPMSTRGKHHRWD